MTCRKARSRPGVTTTSTAEKRHRRRRGRLTLQGPACPPLTFELDAAGTTERALPIPIGAGVPFRVNAFVTARGGHFQGSGHAAAAIRFRGLPPAYTGISCQGFDQPVAAHAATWGGVKALYHR